jgi:hypothetical protein
MKDDGKLVTLITSGALREGNKEIIDNDWLEAVVQLPLEPFTAETTTAA